MALPGLPEFIAKCTSLINVVLECNSMLAAAEADHLLSASCCIQRLKLSGMVMPCILPPTLLDLTADIQCEDCEDTSQSDQQADALLYRAARLQSLEDVTLKFDSSSPAPMDVISLTCPLQLPRLPSFWIWFDLAEQTEVDLSWLQRQPCGRLHVVLSILTSDIDQHAMLVQQLSQLQLTNLDLVIYSAWPYAVQELWASISAQCFWITFIRLTGEGSGQVLLRTLPSADDYTIHAQGPGKLQLAWSALIARGANISVAMRASAELQVLGADSGPPDHLEQPWSLEIDSDLKVEGLPEMQDRGGSLSCRNKAARQTHI